MREVSVFYAYDDTEFFDCDECSVYEKKAYDLAIDIANKIFFFDKDRKQILPNLSFDIEDWITWFDDAYGRCVFCRRKGSFTDDENEFIRHNLSACFSNEDFSCAVGLFKYDEKAYGWVKVDE